MVVLLYLLEVFEVICDIFEFTPGIHLISGLIDQSYSKDEVKSNCDEGYIHNIVDIIVKA